MTLLFGCALALWAGASFIDLSDGQTWEHTKRRYAPELQARGFEVNDFGYYRVTREAHPKEFKQILVLRGVMPTVFFAVFFGACALGWSAQPRVSPDANGH